MSHYEFKLPDVGEGLSEGELVKWYVSVGDAVKVDQIICDVQTDKAIVEIPAPVTGTVSALGGAPGDILPVGALLASFEIDAPAAASGTAASVKHSAGGLNTGAAAPARTALTGHAQADRVAMTSSSGRRVKASPATRKLARQLGLDIASVVPTGDRGQVIRGDLEAAAGGASDQPPRPPTAVRPGGEFESEAGSIRARDCAPLIPDPARTGATAGAIVPLRPAQSRSDAGQDREEPLMGLRRQIAQTMQNAWQNIPHIYSLRELDASALVAARRSVAADLEPQGIALTYMPFFVKACTLALLANPRFNASLDMEAMRIIYRHRINIGIATATPDGLIVTVVHDADRKSLAEIAVEIDELARLGRERKAKIEHLSHGTFTVSNYGSQGAWMGTPIIRPPEVAIAGFGRIEDKVVPVDGLPAVRKVLPLSVATDHRLNDGEHLGDFVNTLVRYLGEPVRMLGHL